MSVSYHALIWAVVLVGGVVDDVWEECCDHICCALPRALERDSVACLTSSVPRGTASAGQDRGCTAGDCPRAIWELWS